MIPGEYIVGEGRSGAQRRSGDRQADGEQHGRPPRAGRLPFSLFRSNKELVFDREKHLPCGSIFRPARPSGSSRGRRKRFPLWPSGAAKSSMASTISRMAPLHDASSERPAPLRQPARKASEVPRWEHESGGSNTLICSGRLWETWSALRTRSFSSRSNGTCRLR